MDPFDAGPTFLEAFRRGAPWALARVYERYEPLVFRFLVGRVLWARSYRGRAPDGARAELEDLVQETFRRVFSPRARAAFDGQRPFKNYLFTIARNLAWTEQRRRQRLVLSGDPSDFDRIQAKPENMLGVRACGSDDGHTLVEDREFLGLIDRFRTSLSPEGRDIFESRYLLGLSQEETARRMGCHRARVRAVEGRLRQKLSAHMAGTGYLQRTASDNSDNVHYVN